MTKVLEILKKTWSVFKVIAVGQPFVLSFPFLSLGMVAAIGHNIFVVVAWITWTVAAVVNISKK